MKDYTFAVFNKLLREFVNCNYNVKTFENYIKDDKQKTLILRHDVDRWPNNALIMAKLEANLGIKATYFFRIIPSVFNPKIIEQIRDLGHEIGYHYEDLVLCNGNYAKACVSFQRNLEKLREIYPVSTICMHGSPLSKWDSKTIWQKYDYRKLGIKAAVNFDIDYNDVFYVTDNGRGWNKTSSSVRDKVQTKYSIPIKNTFHFIELIKNNKLPDKVMLNAHPDTFFDFGLKWVGNYMLLESKNIVKRMIVKYGIIK